MWISGFCLRAATLFYPQPDVWKEEVFHRLCEQLWGKVFALTFTQLISPQSTGAVEFFQGAKFLDAAMLLSCSAKKVTKEGGIGEALSCLLPQAKPPSPMYLSRRALMRVRKIVHYRPFN